MTRRLFLDEAIGERRGVVLLDGRPERLIIERDGDISCQRLGARSVARVRSLTRGLGSAFLEMPEGPDAVAQAGRLVEGQAVEVTVTAEARADKGAQVSLGAISEGAPRLLAGAPDLAARLATFAPGRAVEGGAGAREAADVAETLALEPTHGLPGGGTITIEPTRALTAVDVDLAGKGGGDPRRATRQTNLAAIAEAARLLRLMGLGGLVVIDLAGKGHDGAAFAEAARKAFAPDGAAVSIGPISRFGLFELSLPWSGRPVREVLVDPDGTRTPLTVALWALREVERQAAADRGGRFVVRAAEDVAEAVAPYMVRLTDRLGARIRLEAVAADRGTIEVTTE